MRAMNMYLHRVVAFLRHRQERHSLLTVFGDSRETAARSEEVTFSVAVVVEERRKGKGISPDAA